MQIVRESIFVSAVRSFFNTLLAVLGIIIALFIVMMIFSALASPYQMDDDAIEMRALPDGNGNNTILPGSVPVVLQLDINGVIGMDSLKASDIAAFLRASQQGVFRGNRVKAILLNIDSPGGTAVDSGLIYQALMRYKETYKVPIYAYTPSVAASGSYMIACAADKIYAGSEAIIGSVGVKWGLGLNFYQFMQQHGVEAVTLTAGMDKEKYPTFTKADPAYYQDLQDIIADSYTQFVALVAEARNSYGLTESALRSKYGARVFIAATAKAHGYIDEANASYLSTLGAVVKAAGLDSAPYQVVKFNRKHSPLRDFVSSKLSLLGLKPERQLNNRLVYYYDPQDR